MGGAMKVDFDGARHNLATAYNELAKFLKEHYDDNGDVFIDSFWVPELCKKLEALRVSVGIILLLEAEDDDGKTHPALGDEIDRLEDSDLEG